MCIIFAWVHASIVKNALLRTNKHFFWHLYMIEILFSIKTKNHSTCLLILLYGFVLSNVRNTCYNLRLIILIVKNL